MGDTIETLNKILWSFAFVFIIISGLYFSLKLKGKQFNLISLLKALKSDQKSNISSFDTLMMSTAAKVGVGSLAGVALAIHKGGLGVIFWIWLTSIISAPNAFAEGALGTVYKQKKNKENIGGPAEYISKGLNKKHIGIIYALIVTIVYVICFSTIQANTIATAIYNSYNVKKIIIGILLFYIVIIIIWQDTKKIFNIISKLVPIMGISYIIIGLLIIIKNYVLIPSFFLNILQDALSIKGSSIGIFTSMIIGIQRGIFSNEAGIGTGAIASASADDSITPETQGKAQILGVYFISLIIGTITAFIIASSPYQTITINNPNGIELTYFAFEYHLGKIGKDILLLSIISFAISTIIAGFYYGKSNLLFIWGNLSSFQEKTYKLFIAFLMIVGSITNPNLIWNLSDIFIAVLAIINIYALLALRKEVIKNLKR